MRLDRDHQSLVGAIQRFGAQAQDARQVFKRIKQLMPRRIQDIYRQMKSEGISASSTHRQVFLSQQYMDMVEELSELSESFHLSRIQYETHVMLIDARRSLRAR
jgi:hypothetical protein